MSPSKIAGSLGRVDGIDRLEQTLNVHRPQDLPNDGNLRVQVDSHSRQVALTA